MQSLQPENSTNELHNDTAISRQAESQASDLPSSGPSRQACQQKHRYQHLGDRPLGEHYVKYARADASASLAIHLALPLRPHIAVTAVAALLQLEGAAHKVSISFPLGIMNRRIT